MPDEIRAEHVKLSWMPPEDDGGTPITSYLVRYMDIDSGEWVTACTSSTPNATATGLKPGHLYQFEVSAINKEGQSEPIFTGDPILAENPYSKLQHTEFGYILVDISLRLQDRPAPRESRRLSTSTTSRSP